MPTWRRIPIHCQGSKRHLKVWMVLTISCAWTWSPDSGRSRWMNHWSSTLDLLLVTWDSLSVTTCLGKLNLTYCLIYLNNIIVFAWMAEEHLHHLCIIFDQFREHNLKLKPSKCNFFRDEIIYLAHWVLKDGACPSNTNLKVIAECTPLQTYMEVHAFLGLVGHYQRFIKGFACIAQPLSEYLTGEGASRKSEWVSLT